MKQAQSFSEFNPDSCRLDGVNLIEASAGTGKTYSISTLYQRLIMESDLPVEGILVVTFTEAATEELKDRIRKRIKGSLDALKSNESDSVEGLPSLKDAPLGLSAMKLEIALRSFDRASIFTIHGFCRKILNEQAFETGSMFDFSLEPDLSALDSEIISDFLRSRMDPEKNHDLSGLFVRYLVENNFFSGSVEKLLSETRPYLKIKIEDIVSGVAPSSAEKNFLECIGKIHALWLDEKDSIKACLIDSKSLNGSKYRESTRARLLENIEVLIGREFPLPPLFDDFEKLTESFIIKNTNKGKEPPFHKFFCLCEDLKKASDILEESFRSRLSSLKKEFMEYYAAESDKRKERNNILGFNDLLLKVHDAIKGPMGETICETLRKKYRAALIDEFQDTDHVQYDIFSTVFRGSTPLFLIGDPKQSIYGFRGADIFAYLKAASEADRKHTLSTNWRSDSGFIKAVNTLFGMRENPFVFEGIGYFPSKASAERGEPEFESDDGKGFMEIFAFNGKKADQPKKPENIIYEYITHEISKLISGNARIKGRCVRPGDIAVLVQKHSQGKKLKQYLDAAEIPSVSSGGDDVFKSPEALYIERLLFAVSDPCDTPRIKGALTTPFFGANAEEIALLSHDEGRFDETLQFFRDLHEIWSKKGFMRMFEMVISRHGTMGRIAGLKGGERTLTNLFHIAEILNKRESTGNLHKDELISWLSKRTTSELKGEEEELLRLESDSDAVRIITIHKSKGLEFPVVFCPFPAKDFSRSNSSDSIIVHSPEKSLGSAEYSYYDKSHPDYLRVKKKSEAENLAGSLRLLYVALTRAKHRCHVVLDKDAACGALGYLLFHEGEIAMEKGIDDFRKSISSLDESQKDEILNKLSRTSEGTITVSDAFKSEGDCQARQPSEVTDLGLMQPKRRIRQGKIITSFSGIVSGATFLKTDPDVLEASFQWEPLNNTDSKKNDVNAKTIFDFPKGREAGNFFHSFLEKLDFSADKDSIKTLAEKKLLEFGFDSSWSDSITFLASGLASIELGHPGKKFTLSSITNKNRINEMGFYYPIKKMNPGTLHEIINQSALDMERLNFSPLKGFMRGFMDMIFMHDGLFYLVDWKSNHLGDNESEYSSPKIMETMKNEYYIIQYHLYVIALDLFLKTRIKNYSYENHFGGVFYVFLRGIGNEENKGIYFDRPDEKLIKKLSSEIIGT